MYYVNKNNIMVVANEITGGDFFGDEIGAVACHLQKLVDDANNYGCEFSRPIPNMWGGHVTVTAKPVVYRHYWRF